MKVLLVCALLVACANARSFNSIGQKLLPSFATGYIINGQDAVPGSAPYMLSLSRIATEHVHFCGGTLIDKNCLLTAAHCIDTNAVGMGVMAGLHKRTNYDARTQARVVDYGKVHENYTGEVGPSDIALLCVSEPFEFTEWVQPAVLPAPEQIHEGETHMYGWGRTNPFLPIAALILQTVKTVIVEFSKCKSIFPKDAPLHPTNVCTGSMKKGISACNGDSGGPMVKEFPNAPSVLIGIVSFGMTPCGLAQMPTVHTRVSAYIGWISEAQTQFYKA